MDSFLKDLKSAIEWKLSALVGADVCLCVRKKRLDSPLCCICAQSREGQAPVYIELLDPTDSSGMSEVNIKVADLGNEINPRWVEQTFALYRCSRSLRQRALQRLAERGLKVFVGSVNMRLKCGAACFDRDPDSTYRWTCNCPERLVLEWSLANRDGED